MCKYDWEGKITFENKQWVIYIIYFPHSIDILPTDESNINQGDVGHCLTTKYSRLFPVWSLCSLISSLFYPDHVSRSHVADRCGHYWTTLIFLHQSWKPTKVKMN